ADLRENPKNWRRHPARQRQALRGVLAQIGYADALLARVEGDDLVLLDGHLRREVSTNQMVPVLVTDLSAEEGDLLLATLDPISGLATPDPDRLAALLDSVGTQSRAVQDLLDLVASSAKLPLVQGLADPE